VQLLLLLLCNADVVTVVLAAAAVNKVAAIFAALQICVLQVMTSAVY
jgi:hypothetical protein